MALTGESKMSASNPNSAIYTIDDEKTIRRKIANAYTGGRPTAEEQRRLGGNPDVCPVYHYHMAARPLYPHLPTWSIMSLAAFVAIVLGPVSIDDVPQMRREDGRSRA